MEIIHCDDCGYTGENEDNGLDSGELMDRLECGEIDWDEYQDLLEGTRFACPSCGSLQTQVAEG